MTILDILEFPDPRLRTKAAPVEEVNSSIRKLCDNMLETMYHAEGIGLAATQINVHKRVIVIDVSENRKNPITFINPAISIVDEETQEHDEGCLSVPGFNEVVNRPRKISVTALDKDGNEFTQECEGILATCLQHEMDHLNGKLFVDYISKIKRQKIRKSLEKQHREQAL